jgi:hypothetical protein
MLLNSGVPLEVVSEVLGHSSIAITGDVYGHVTPDVSLSGIAWTKHKRLQVSMYFRVAGIALICCPRHRDLHLIWAEAEETGP